MPKCGACGIPVDDVEWSSPQRGAHRAPGQTIGSYKGTSTTAGLLLGSLVNHLSKGADLVLADLALDALADLVPMPVPARSESPYRNPEQKPHHRCNFGDPMLRHSGALAFAS